MAPRGITLEELDERTKRDDADPLDLLIHVALQCPAGHPQQRAEKLKQQKTNFFNQYEPAAREILDSYLEKYADFGYSQLEDIQGVWPGAASSEHGNLLEIAALFGGPLKMKVAVDQMKQLLYQTTYDQER